MRRLIVSLALALAAGCQQPVAQVRLVDAAGSAQASPRPGTPAAATRTPTPAPLPAPTTAHVVSWPVTTRAEPIGQATLAPVAAASSLPLAPGVAPLRPQATPAPLAVAPTRVIVSLLPEADELAVLASGPYAKLDEFTMGGRRVLAVKPPAGESVGGAIAHLRTLAGVAQVQADQVRRRFAYPFVQPDPRFGEQWAHRPDRANTELAWTLVPANQQIRVLAAVLDSGLDVTHPEFGGRIQGAMNFSVDTPTIDVTDFNGHGTHVTGILAAGGNNGVGVAGVAWGVGIVPVKVLDQDGAGTDFGILKGFAYAVHYRPTPDSGARVRVINMSLGGEGGGVSALWTDAVAEANANGIVVVAASGNDGRDVIGSPANTPGVVAVGSTANYLAWETLSTFSTYGDRLDLVAPGEGILSTLPLAGSTSGTAYGYDTGTSMASPFVAGVAALIAARYDANNAQLNATFGAKIRRRLATSADDLGVPGRDPLYGEGRVNAGRAVSPASIDAAP